MVAGKYKSRTKRRIYVKMPGNSVKIHYRRRKPGKAVCPKYGTVLNGVPRGNRADLSKLPKTKKRPQRPYGGVLSSKAMRDKMKAKARSLLN